MEIFVYADWFELKGPQRMGVLSVAHGKGQEVFSFSYDKEWISGGQAQNIDPELQLISGPQFSSIGKNHFGVFNDASPDRWGQELIKRHAALTAKLEKRKEESLFYTDFLLGVQDLQRPGALRFKLKEDECFLDGRANPSPPWTALRELEFASLELEKENLEDSETLKWLNMLIAPGASLGGARPKAGVSDEKGNLWIAKFPGAGDLNDTGAWEMVVNALAKDAGLDVAEAQSKKFSSKHHTYLSKRFDRIGTKRRVHFASAKTLIGQKDGTEHASYMDIAGLIIKQGADPKRDLEELWRRIVFNIAVKNTDDHLGNHGFLLTNKGWSLSPAFDMNPNPQGQSLTLNISHTDNELEFSVALSVAKYFRVEKDAASIIKRVRRCVGKWESVAKKCSIPAAEMKSMEGAFEHD